MKWNMTILTCLSVVTLSINSSIAAVSLPCGWYLEGNYGFSKEDGKDFPGVTSIKNTATGWNVSGGYKFMRYLAAEIGYTGYRPVRLNSPTVTVARDNYYSLDAAGKLILPLFQTGFELFGKVGVTRLNSQVGIIDSNAASLYGLTFNTKGQATTGLYIGGGVDYYFTPNIAVNIQYERANGDSASTGNLSLLSAGISYLLDPALL